MLSWIWTAYFSNSTGSSVTNGRLFFVHWAIGVRLVPNWFTDLICGMWGEVNGLPQRATSHTTLKAHDHCILGSLIGWEGWDWSSSLESEGLRAQINYHGWKSLHGFLHDILLIMYHGLPEFASGPPPRGSMTQIMIDHVKVKSVRRPTSTAFEWETRVLIIQWSWPLAHVWSGPKIDFHPGCKGDLKVRWLMSSKRPCMVSTYYQKYIPIPTFGMTLCPQTISSS